MPTFLKKAFNLFRDFFVYFLFAWRSRLFLSYCRAFFHSFLLHMNEFRHSLYSKGAQLVKSSDEKIEKLKSLSSGLHALMPPDPRFSYSLLMPVGQSDPERLKKSIRAALNQSSPSFELLIGFSETPSQEIQSILSAFLKSHPNQLKIFYELGKSDHALMINRLAEEASKHFLLIVGQEDWLRPDFLFRYEQTLRVFSNPENVLLYCNLNRINDRDYFIPQSEVEQPSQLHFPLFFEQFNEKGLMVPKRLWQQVKGLRSDCQGALYEDLLLRLDLAGASFQHLPLFLYTVHAAASLNHEASKSRHAFLDVLRRYTQAKGLNWEWSPGYLENNARAKPLVDLNHSIQVIIPYKDQKELTLRCVECLLRQKDVNFKITAIDNRSKESSIAAEIEALGGEVIAVDEPFNYSRLNNLALKLTKKASDCDLLLFLNNDVELECDALSEMVRWIDQPGIGMVGCRLHYPDGRLQHGGVTLSRGGKGGMHWDSPEKLLTFDQMRRGKSLAVYPAVTAACAMVKKSIFLEIGGFDEVWYPIAYSDTNLAVKLEKWGLKSFYTPYAVGIHYESVSRKSSIEDYENSWWLHELLLQHETQNSFIPKPLQGLDP